MRSGRVSPKPRSPWNYKCPTDTLKSACLREFGIPFPEWLEAQKSKGRAQLRVERFKKALRGNVRLMIWLSRQWFGESVREAFTVDSTHSVQIYLPDNGRDPELSSATARNPNNPSPDSVH